MRIHVQETNTVELLQLEHSDTGRSLDRIGEIRIQVGIQILKLQVELGSQEHRQMTRQVIDELLGLGLELAQVGIRKNDGVGKIVFLNLDQRGIGQLGPVVKENQTIAIGTFDFT